MFRKFFRSKIHRATVTHADINYEGSITIPEDLLELAHLAEYESVHVWNVTRGTRLETYTIKGARASTDICINGAAAHLCTPGDIVIIASFAWLDQESIGLTPPRVVFLDQHNRVKEIRGEIPGP